ncbi:MAG: hypothetical protein DI562_02300 [Stenotrophomonas acidaminiphila]|nr:MAG: hypothetical protein DI562_02300 [Stenotrophomonas acidaminiphila]
MLKIAVVTPMLPIPQDRTRGRYIHETARALSQLATVRVFFQQPRYLAIPGLTPRNFLTGTAGADYSADGIDVETFTYPAVVGLSRVTNGYVAGRALTPRVRAFAPDVVVGYWIYPDAYAAWQCAERLGVPCVAGALGSDIHVRAGANAAFTRRTVAGVDALVTVSEAMRRTAIADFDAPPARVHTVVNGFNTGVFHPRDRQAMRGKLGIASDARLMVYVGRLVESKGLRELLAAFAALSGTDPSLQLALVGEGVMRDELERMVQTAGLQGRVAMPGGMEPAQVAEWICASDLLTLPSWSEGYPNVVVEALACGVPVVATDVGGTREIIDDSKGLLIPPRDERVLAQALSQALSHPWDHAAIAASMNRSWHDVARETLDVCKQVLAARRRA